MRKMIAVLLTILLALGAALLAGVNMYGALRQTFPYADAAVFGVVILLGILLVRTVSRVIRSERKMREMTMNLETANIKLTQLDKLKSEFLSFASHQIKAPMTVVKGYATLIMDGSYGPISGQIKEVAEKIKTSADRMISLVNTFLDLRRIDEGKMQYTFEDADLGQLVASVVDEMQQLATGKKLRLTLAPMEHPYRAHIDPQHLRQVLQNFIDNAIKYTDAGSIAVALRDGSANTVVVSVTDTGRGMGQQLLPKLFEQFSRDQSVAKEIAGTGLGLYIAKQIIVAHQGNIWATSPGLGKGSTFAFEIPVI